MPLEPNVDDISDLDENSPIDPDFLSETDDHIRNIKEATIKTFTDMHGSGGTVTVSSGELNSLAGATGNVQAQLDTKSAATIYWSVRTPDVLAAPRQTWNMTPNERLLPFFDPPAGGSPAYNEFNFYLPTIASSSDGDIVEIKPSEVFVTGTDSVAIRTFDDPFRMYINNPLSIFDGQWQNATVVGFTPLPYPHILAIFNSTFNQWVVRSLDAQTRTVIE